MTIEVQTPTENPRVHLPGDPNPSKDILGGKGYGLAVMHQLKLPVPAFFTIGTDVCRKYLENPEQGLPEELQTEVLNALRTIEESAKKKFGDPNNPLLVSVRSGAKDSMPGMMDTVLNLGLNDDTVKEIAKKMGDRFALDTYRRFIQLYGSVVLNIDKEQFSKRFDEIKKENGISEDSGLGLAELTQVVVDFKTIVNDSTGVPFPQDANVQLEEAIKAVFNSWDSERAIRYRKENKIDNNLGTAVNIQEMKFGNIDEGSGTGVLFTRNPNTGENELYGNFLQNAQGEDVVAGIRNTLSIEDLKSLMPDIYEQLKGFAELLEAHFGDPQDIEFTIQNGELFLLQTRSAKRSAKAAVRIAHSYVEEMRITREQAISRLTPQHINQLFHPMFDPEEMEKAKNEGRLLTTGTAGSPGAATGIAVFDSKTAEMLAAQGIDVILIRDFTEAEDVSGMYASKGILTARGGPSSHAAVVARGHGTPAVIGASDIEFDENMGVIRINGKEIKQGDKISIDGSTGEVFLGDFKLILPDKISNIHGLTDILSWADKIARLKVWTNADTPSDSRRARDFGAIGVGLDRSEHMFFDDARLKVFRDLILTPREDNRYQSLLEEIKEIQRSDFEGILKEMDGFPVVIRLLDPPLHEFLPNQIDLIAEIAKLKEQRRNKQGRFASLSEEERVERDSKVKQAQELLDAVVQLAETNPMLGLRGARLGISRPEIYDIQIRAVLEAASKLKKEGSNPKPKIMIPLITGARELEVFKKRFETISKETGANVECKFGSMIEVPSAASASEISKIVGLVDFISFGTNDLTQLILGLSRDDAARKITPEYIEMGLFDEDPFVTLHPDVKNAIQIAVEAARAVKPDIEIGICGEHGADPASIKFFNDVGFDYISLSPYSVPSSRLATAQAVLAL